QEGPAAKRGTGRDRRSLRRGPGGARRLLGGRVRRLGPCHRDRRPLVGLPGAGVRPRKGRRRYTTHRRAPPRPGVLIVLVADDTPVEDLLRQLAPEVLGAVVRRYGSFDLAEDAVQEALLAPRLQWPNQGVPDRPRPW